MRKCTGERAENSFAVDCRKKYSRELKYKIFRFFLIFLNLNNLQDLLKTLISLPHEY